MPLTPLEPGIELSDFSQGWVPDPDEEVGLPPNALADSENLLLDQVTGTVVTRKGFKRLIPDAGGPQGYRSYSVNYYRTDDGKDYLMCVLSNDTGGVNNIQIRALDLNANPPSWTQVSPTGKTWASSNGRHWGVSIDGAFYGGGPKEPMYRWYPPTVVRGAHALSTAYKRGDGVTYSGTNYTALRDHTSHDGSGGTLDNRHGTTDGRDYWTTEWKDDVGTPAYPYWEDAFTSLTKRMKDYAYKENEAVRVTYTYQGDTFTKAVQAKKDIRYPKWDNGHARYREGNRVGTKETPADATFGTGAYWRAWECTDKHEPTAANKPGTAEGRKYWKKVRLADPIDDDGKVNTKHWREIPDAPKTHIAAWQGNRLMARNDEGPGGRQVIVYSRLQKVGDKDNVKTNKQDTVGQAGDPTWDADDWRAGGEGGAGFQPIETKENDDIMSIVPFGRNTIIFKRFTTFVIAGVNPATWEVRALAPVGSLYKKAATEHEGYVYFVSDRGFFRTDGTSIEVPPGADKIGNYLLQKLDGDIDEKNVELGSDGRRVWISIPGEVGDKKARVILYDPLFGSFWPQDIRLQTMTKARRAGRDIIVFSTITHTSEEATAAYSWSGTPHQSTSQRVIGADTRVNVCTNPSMEAANKWDKPRNWQKTTEGKVDLKATKAAARWHKFGCEISNLRKTGDTGGTWLGHEGMMNQVSDGSTGTMLMQFRVRREHWKKNPKRKPQARGIIDNTIYDILDDHWKYLGDGWWTASFHFVGSMSARNHGIVCAAGTSVDVDQVIIQSNPTGNFIRFFDGDGGEDTNDLIAIGGGKPFVMQYDHPDADDKDDAAKADTTLTDPIQWHMRSAWLTFGAMREERRIRAIWSLVRGSAVSLGIRVFRNFQSKVATGETQTIVQPDSEVQYFEGLLPEDCHSIQLQVEGESSPAAVLSLALNTQPRRLRTGTR